MNLLYNPPAIQRSIKKVDTENETVYRNYLGQLHRVDGPAVIRKCGQEPREEYYHLGQLHRIDGPARIWADGSFEYYLFGILAGGGPTAQRFFPGQEPREEWRDEQGRLHREGGPAIIRGNGEKRYYQQGQLHRQGGPAIDRTSLEAKKEALRQGKAFAAWYLHGKKSREDGPAEIYGIGAHVYWLNGQMHRQDGPAIVHTDRLSPQGYRQGWMREGRPHRQDGPAIVDALGKEYYYLEGVLHNTQGPAIVSSEGEEYYFEGMPLTREAWVDIVKE